MTTGEHLPEPKLLFIDGFHRSGTTVLTTALTEAVGGVTTTVECLARRIPTLESFLAAGGGDRGVDRLQVVPQMAEEYGFLLRYRTGKRSIYESPDGLAVLREHIAELAAEAPAAPVVLKNPWDTGNEARILDDLPTATMIIVRRRVAEIEASVERALARLCSSNAYSHALSGAEGEPGRRLADIFASRWKRTLVLTLIRTVLRWRMFRLAGRVGALPLDRVAFVSYDELRVDAYGAAVWAAHLVDPASLAEAFTRHAFAESSAPVHSGLIQRALDRRWRRAWDRMRAAQVRVAVLPSPQTLPPERAGGTAPQQ